MIATLRGKILGNTDQQLIVEVGGVGFAVTTVPGVRLGSEMGQEIFLFTALIVREDAFTLFGYQSSSERDLFQLLQTVSGIGPKGSHAILSTLTISEIITAITAGDSRTLEQVSGLGKKGAQRIILELKERVAEYGLHSAAPSTKMEPSNLSLAQALAGLGFNSKEIDHALDIVKNSAVSSLEEGLKIALAALHNGGSRV
jgi:Holliday junction DNA helicase RuvA